MNRIPYKLSFFFLIAFLPLIYSQEIRYDRIDFMENPSWSEVLSIARQTGKVIFFDGYTTWCGPCKKMDKEVFSQPQVANYFNQKFINVKYNMEDGEGPKLKNRYGITAFPTYLFITGSGEVIHKIVGAQTEGNTFLEYSKLATVTGQSYSDLQIRYRNGERNSDLIFSYLKALRMAGEMEKEKGIVDDYLRLMTADHFMDASYWGIVKVFLKNPASREFRILLENRKEVSEAIGQKEVDEKIYSVLDDFIRKNMDFNNWNLVKKEDGETVIEHIRHLDFAERNELLARALVAQHYRNGDYYDFTAVVDAMIDFNLLGNYENQPALFIEYAGVINKMAVDAGLLKKALRWVEMINEKELSPAEKTNYFKVKEALGGKL